MLMLLLFLDGSALFALLRLQTNRALKAKRFLMRKQFSQTVSINQSGFCALYATVITICCVLLLVQMKQSIISTRKAHLCVHLWDVDSDIFNRYVKRYKKPTHFFDFRMPPKTKQTKKVRNLEVNRTPSAASKGKYSKRSPQSSHRGEKVAEYTMEEMMHAKEVWEANAALPLDHPERKSQREVSELVGIKLGTLSKRITGKVPWTRNVGGQRIPKVLTKGTVFLYR